MCRFSCEHKFSTPLGKYQGAQLLGRVVRVCIVCKKLPNCLPKWLYYSAFSPAMNESDRCFTSPPAFGVVSVPNFGHSNRCVAVPHCCFNLHFPNDIWCGASFHTYAYLPSLYLVWYIYICNRHEVSLALALYFLIELFVFLLLHFKNSLYILDTSPLYSPCILVTTTISKHK